MAITFNDYSDEVLEAFDEAALRALERCGLQAEGYAKDLVPVDTGNLRNSISHKVDSGEPAAYIGTNSEYAAYVEFGTGRYSATGGGTPKDHWVYMGDDGNISDIVSFLSHKASFLQMSLPLLSRIVDGKTT